MQFAQFASLFQMDPTTHIYHQVSKDKDVYLIPKGGKHTETVIFLHGLGDSATGPWLHVFLNKVMSPWPTTAKVVLLSAPTASVTARMGMKMPSWYDIKGFSSSVDGYEKSIGMEEVIVNTKRVQDVMKEEIEQLGGDSKKLVLAGFSQGVAMALHAGLTYNQPLGAIVGWAGWFFPITKTNKVNEGTPIFLGNGVEDSTVPFKMADKSFKLLDGSKRELVRVNDKNCGHIISENIGRKTAEFLMRVLGKVGK